MKKTISVLLALALLLSMTACVSVKAADIPIAKARTETAPSTEAPADTEAPTQEPIPTEEPTPAPTEEPTPAPTEEPFETVMADALKKLQEVESLRMDMNMNLEMGVFLSIGKTEQTIPVEIDMTYSMDMTRDPDVVRIDMAISSMAGDRMSSLIYGVRDGETTILYTSEDNGATWQKRTNPQTSQLPKSPGEALGLFLSLDGSQFQRTGVEEVNGRPAMVYTGKVSGQFLQDILDSTGASEELSGVMGDDLPEDALSNMSDILVTFLIDEETGLPVRYVMDMTQAMKDLLDILLTQSLGQEDLGDMELRIDVPAVVMDITLSQFDSIEPIVVPEAALNTPEL